MPCDTECFCRAYRCETCLPDSEIWVIHHDQPEHEKLWNMLTEKFRKAKAEFYPEKTP